MEASGLQRASRLCGAHHPRPSHALDHQVPAPSFLDTASFMSRTHGRGEKECCVCLRVVVTRVWARG
eukprot:3288412-Rhodomonas_salina.1